MCLSVRSLVWGGNARKEGRWRWECLLFSLPFLLRDQSAGGIRTGNERKEKYRQQEHCLFHIDERLCSATTEPLPLLNLQWSGCLCRITGRAHCKPARHTPTHACTLGENSHILGEEGRGQGSLPLPRKGSTWRATSWASRASGQEHPASWANCSPRVHNFPVKQTDGCSDKWCTIFTQCLISNGSESMHVFTQLPFWRGTASVLHSALHLKQPADRCITHRTLRGGRPHMWVQKGLRSTSNNPPRAPDAPPGPSQAANFNPKLAEVEPEGLVLTSHPSQGPRSWLRNSAGESSKSCILLFFNRLVYFMQVVKTTTRPALTTFPLLGGGARAVLLRTIPYYRELRLYQEEMLSKARDLWGCRRGGFLGVFCY